MIYRKLLSITICLMLCGCASLITKSSDKVVVLPEERIYTLPAGQEVTMNYDGKPITLSFKEDMKIVSSTVLVRQEMRLNEEALKASKAKEEANKKLGIIGSIFACLAAGLGIFFKMKQWKPNLKVEIK